MKEKTAKKVMEKYLLLSDIEINGERPWDLQVNNPAAFDRIASGGSLAMGESYMDGWWDCDALDQFFEKIFENKLDQKLKTKSRKPFWTSFIKARKIVSPDKSKAYEIGERHYDKGNKLFTLMLDKRLNYSCGYWEKASTLDEAQEAKLDLVCRKLDLKPGMKVLDIGCGWGAFVKYAAEEYGVSVEGITVSKQQQVFAEKLCQGLDVKIELKDYREISGKFDRIVSIGMFEHVGYKNYRKFMELTKRCLTEDGLFLLHTIGRNDSGKSTDSWIAKYIFPNSMLPSAGQITTASEGLFIMEDWHNFGQYYDNTLMAWYDNFSRNWHFLKEEYDERFFRMWRYYLLSCAGIFRARIKQLWQIVFSKNGLKWGYRCQR
ncbi:MAG: Cyclopropane-fatty-acyl-phospholipid synthase [Deltaproteobacteria bacterium]|jgi:cyclopropane-fatty-acyl-phospholipid synthase|nr:Cyclopropane-fatty-acyl-phospholipid synthase [Deltaproteobacteria bacterium]